MSKKHRLLNRNSYMTKYYNLKIMTEYINDYEDDELNDNELFEFSIIYLLEAPTYKGRLKYKNVLKKINTLNLKKVREWIHEDLSSSERARLLDAVNSAFKLHNTKVDLSDKDDYEIDAWHMLGKAVVIDE